MASASGPDLIGLVVRSLALYVIAEAQAGHAHRLIVTVDGHAFSVGDDGRSHVVERRVEGHPYLTLVYQQLAFPFDAPTAPPVQLQGIATSLVHGLCSAFSVTVRRDGQVHELLFGQDGMTRRSREADADEGGGNTIAGMLHATLPVQTDVEALACWLRDAAAAVPGLQAEFNGRRLGP